MHISDGVLPPTTLALGAAGTLGLGAWTLRAVEEEDVPRLAVFTATFFVGSYLSFPIPPTSVHLTLVGLVGVVLGRVAFLAILTGVALQAVLFQHGGLTAIGVNAMTMGCGALVAGALFARRGPGVDATRDARAALLAALAGGAIALALYAAALLTSATELRRLAELAFLIHVPLVVAEALLTGACVRFLARVEPRLLRRRAEAPAPETPS